HENLTNSAREAHREPGNIRASILFECLRMSSRLSSLFLLRAHPALRSAWLIWLVMVATSTLTRAVLVLMAWPDIELTPGAIFDIAANGTGADVLFAFACAAPALFIGALAHRGSAPGRLRRGWRLAVTTAIVAAAGFA